MAVLPLIFVKHDSMAPSVNERCTGPQPGDGCGATFPYKTNAGLCARCHLLDEQTTPDEARRTILGVCYLLHLTAAHKLTCLMFFRNTLSAWNAELLEKPSEKIIVGLVHSVVWLQKFMFCCLTC
jgi:hypothetical protein